MQRTGAAWLATLLALALAVIAPTLATAQSAAGDMPKNAHMKSYGSGWECDSGYRKTGKACIAIKVPDNAYPTNASYGRGWECAWGFRQVSENCMAITVPANGFLNPSGERWECERGYQKIDEACVAIAVPDNAFLVDSSFGRGWKCARGFRTIGKDCTALTLPKNAHLDYSGNDWECDRPYRRQQEACIAP